MSTGDWSSALGWIRRVIGHCATVDSPSAFVTQFSATRIPRPDEFFDAVFYRSAHITIASLMQICLIFSMYG